MPSVRKGQTSQVSQMFRVLPARPVMAADPGRVPVSPGLPAACVLS